MPSQILVVLELDETSNQVADCLKAAGFKVSRCNSFAAAMKILETKEISLVIADVHPENGGSVFDFIRFVKKNPLSKTTPFILFSLRPTKLAKYLEDGVRTTSRLLGCDMYMSMERFDNAKFLKQIQSLLPPQQEVTTNNIIGRV